MVGRRVTGIRLATPSLLRSVHPPLSAVEGKTIVGLRRLGKRVVVETSDELFLVFHLMIAGRFRWKPAGAHIPGKVGLLALDFEHGSLILTEAGSKRQASLYVVQGVDALAQHDPGGLEVMTADLAAFAEALRRDNHTLKRALTDPHLFSGIGNAYSDEILHAARPLAVQTDVDDDGCRCSRLYEAVRLTLQNGQPCCGQKRAMRFQRRSTAFRMGCRHGRYGKPSPIAARLFKRIVYAANEANYCANCQTGGRLLADRRCHACCVKIARTLEELRTETR